MSEEPEEVHALMDYLCTFFESVAEKVVPILQPDIIALADEIGQQYYQARGIDFRNKDEESEEEDISVTMEMLQQSVPEWK